MKIALCFYGHPSNIDTQTYGSIKDKLFPNNEVDVYAHVWYSDDPSVVLETITRGTTSYDATCISTFTEAYSPKNIITELPLTRDIITRSYNENRPDSAYHTISRYTSIQKVLNSIPDPSQYTFIILLRSDLVLINMPDLNTLDTTKIHVSAIGGCNETIVQAEFLLFPPSLISTFANIVNNIDTWSDEGVTVDARGILNKAIDDNKSNLSLLKFEEFNNALKRADGRVNICRDQF